MFALIGNFDFNKDGKISFGEFVQSLWQLQRIDDAKDVMMVSRSMMEPTEKSAIKTDKELQNVEESTPSGR